MPSLTRRPGKFEPPAGKRLLVVGQELAALGGFSGGFARGWLSRRWRDGYTEHLGAPAGTTVYISLKTLGGLNWSPLPWWRDSCARCLVKNPIYRHSVLAVGLDMVGQEADICRGRLDAKIAALSLFLRASARPVFLRVGYEFDGSWNRYEPEAYRAAYAYLHQRLAGPHCAFVWQAATSPVNGRQRHSLMDWYPGDERVDWLGYSWFLSCARQEELTDQLLDVGRQREKPVMVCESAPQGYDLARATRRNIGPVWDGPAGEGCRPHPGSAIWEAWYAPFFDYLDKHRDLIKVVSYINTNWDAQFQWGPPYRQGYWGDSRVQMNSEVLRSWREKVNGPQWLPAGPQLFAELGAVSAADAGAVTRAD